MKDLIPSIQFQLIYEIDETELLSKSELIKCKKFNF